MDRKAGFSNETIFHMLGGRFRSTFRAPTLPVSRCAARYTRGVRIRVSEEIHGPHTLEQLHEILRGYPGNCELELTICLADGSRAACKCDNTKLAVTPEMQARVDQLLGPGNFRLLTSSPSAATAGRGNGRSRR